MAFFVQQALQNTSNAYLAFAGNTSRTYTNRQDFVARGQLFSATLQQVAALNTGLQDFFLTVNEFADQTQAERNVVNGVKGLKKVRGGSAASALQCDWLRWWPCSMMYLRSLRHCCFCLQAADCQVSRRRLQGLSPPRPPPPRRSPPPSRPPPLRPPPRRPPPLRPPPAKSPPPPPPFIIPTSLDWRDQGVVPPVLNQVRAGSERRRAVVSIMLS